MSRGNDFPPYLSRSATHRGYADPNLSLSLQNEQLRWDHQPSFQDNTRFAAPTEYRPSEDRLPISSFRLASVPLDPYLPTRIIILNNMGSRATGHRFPPVPDQVTPIFLNQQNMHAPSRTNESTLNQEEQETVLRKLKREIYNPMPKMLARRGNLYYRDLNRDPNNKAVDNEHRDEDGKSCAVCLEDFEPREEVMVTPCRHMFHEECIVPWLKSHGQCPVCRFALFERRRENCSNLNNSNNYVNNSNRIATLTANNDMFAGELISLIQAVDEAFPWRAYS